MKTKKDIWYQWENIALKYFLEKWYQFVEKNFTIRGWEIDLIVKKQNLVFVEVKNIDSIDNIQNYITNKKLKSLQKTIWVYVESKNIQDYRLDIVFVKNWKIFEHFENIYID